MIASHARSPVKWMAAHHSRSEDRAEVSCSPWEPYTEPLEKIRRVVGSPMEPTLGLPAGGRGGRGGERTTLVFSDGSHWNPHSETEWFGAGTHTRKQSGGSPLEPTGNFGVVRY